MYSINNCTNNLQRNLTYQHILLCSSNCHLNQNCQRITVLYIYTVCHQLSTIRHHPIRIMHSIQVEGIEWRYFRPLFGQYNLTWTQMNGTTKCFDLAKIFPKNLCWRNRWPRWHVRILFLLLKKIIVKVTKKLECVRKLHVGVVIE